MKTKNKILIFFLAMVMAGAVNAAADRVHEEPPPSVPTHNEPTLSASESAQIIKDDSKNAESRIEGRNPLETDGSIDEEIRTGLLTDKTLSGIGKDVRVTTLDETVILRGTVKSEDEKAKVEDRVRKLAHGKEVESELTVVGR